jgi:CDP-6-deoxy-D-xylo-4-hexulose-3-dehydrase
MMRSHGWDRDLPKHIQNKLRDENKVNEFDSLYTFYLPGMNLRSTDLQAFIGLRSIDKLDGYSKKRNENFKEYQNLITKNKINTVENEGDFVSNFALPIVSKNKNKIVNRLISEGVEVRPLIAGDMSKKPMWYERYGKVSLPNCERINEFGFYIPNHQDLSENQIKLITDIINE